MPPSASDEIPEAPPGEQSPADTAERNLKKANPPGADWAPPQPIRRRLALLIGVAEYQNGGDYLPLKYTTNDVAALKKALLAYGYASALCVDTTVADPKMLPTHDNIRKQIQTFCDEAHSDDLIWIHFSCHGTTPKLEAGKEVKLLIACDTSPDDLLATAIGLEEDVINVLRDCKARQKVLSLDACDVGYGRAVANSTNSSELPFLLGEGLAVVTASGKNQAAQESQEFELGVFTKCLIDALHQEVESKGFAEFHETVSVALTRVDGLRKPARRIEQKPTHSIEGRGKILLVDRRATSSGATKPENSPEYYEDKNFQIKNYVRSATEPHSCDSLSKTYFASTSGDQDRPSSQVYLTVINKKFIADPQHKQDLANFHDKLSLALELQIDGIARVTRGKDEITSDQRLYFATDRLLGKNLRDALADSPRALPVVIKWARQLAKTLHGLHQVNLFHCDLNLEKIYIVEEKPVITDVVTSALDVKLRLAAKPAPQRSPYWAPELQPDPKTPPATSAADVYALAEVIRELVNQAAAASVTVADVPDEVASLHALIAEMQQGDPKGRPKLPEVIRRLKDPPSGRSTSWRPAVVAAGLVGLAALVGGVSWKVLRGPAAPVAKPVSETPEQHRLQLEKDARAVIDAALKLKGRSDEQLVRTAIVEVSWLRDAGFGEAIKNILLDGERDGEIRSNAARALGRIGYTEAIPALRKVAQDSRLGDVDLWSQVLQALALLEDPQQVLSEFGAVYLKPKGPVDPARRQVVAVQFAASDPQAHGVHEKLAAASRPKHDATNPRIQHDYYLTAGAALAISGDTRRELEKLLTPHGAPSERQIGLAITLAEDGDQSAITFLKKYSEVLSDGNQRDEIRLALTRVKFFSDQTCVAAGADLAEALGEAAAELYARIHTLPMCKQPERFLPELEKIFVHARAHSAGNADAYSLQAVHAAAAIIDVVQHYSARKRTNGMEVGEQSEAYRIRAIAGQRALYGLLLRYLRTALNTQSRPLARQQAAARVQLLTAERAPADAAASTAAEDSQVRQMEAQLEELQSSANTTERIVGLLAISDQELLSKKLAQEKDPQVQQAIAYRVQSPLANDILLHAATGKDLAAIRAYGELHQRGQDVPLPAVDLLAAYDSRSPEVRVEVVESLSGWPFATARPVLQLAARDGYVEVRRSALRIIGEAVTTTGSEVEALGVARLMFGDPDWLVQLYLRDMFEGEEMNASTGPESPPLPPARPSAPSTPNTPSTPSPHPAQPARATAPQPCILLLNADDAEVVVEVDGAQRKLPAEITIKPGPEKHRMTYADDRGEVRTRELSCLTDESRTIAIPVSRIGQLLGEGIQLWNNGNQDGARERFNKVKNGAASLDGMHGPEAIERTRDVLSRSSYYLGEVFLAQNQRVDARAYFDNFLLSPTAGRYPELAKQAQAQRDSLQRQLGRFVIRVLSDGSCQTYTVWAAPGEGKSIQVSSHPPQTFSGINIWPGKETAGNHQCP